jgi:hypothetical protein
MKTILFIAFVVCGLQVINAQKINTMQQPNVDSVAITKALEDIYFKGIYEGDVTLLNNIYYKGTLMFGDVKDEPYAKTLEQYLDGVAHRQSPKDFGKIFNGKVLDVRVVNSIAVAEVMVKMYDFNYHEFLSFHKMDGKWLIVNKMISDIQP